MTSSRAQPWLSVLVPVYNVEAYLRACVESVMAQADDGIEVLLLDDCSTDGSAALAQQLQARWPQAVRLLHHAENRGLSAARNTMLEACRGDYVWLLDSDDFLLPGVLQSLRAVVSTHAPDAVLCDFQMWRERSRLKHQLRGERHRRSFIGPSHTLVRDRAALLQGLMLSGQMHAWSKIVKRALWMASGARFPEGAYFEDMATMPRLALHAQTFWYEPQPWVAYRQRDGSILASMTLAKARDLSVSLRAFASQYRQQAAYDARLRDADVRFAISHVAARNYLGAMRVLEQIAADASANASALPADASVQDESWAEQFARDFVAVSPLAPEALLWAYLKKGWWARYWRARSHVRRAAAREAPDGP